MQRCLVALTATIGMLVAFATVAHAQNGGGLPTFQVPTLPGVTEAKQPQQVALTLQILVMLTVLSVAPAILVMMTAFTRIVIVLSFVRSALGTQNIPPNQVMLGLALFLTFFIMAPTFKQVNDNAIQPYMSGKIGFQTAFDRGELPLAQFMIRQTYKDDLNLFLRMSNTTRPQSLDKLSLTILVPAFVISELKTGFIFGFIVYIPFIIIDLVVSSLLMSMGMMMLPPTVISLPAKVLVFILADGWHSIVGSLAQSYK
ncbi:MAG TPA: flagellar type III secretion system pore protein FliP [Capsulimonadaceae bacterium]|jgi:flagellar biosynthetic protein FliP